MLSIYCSVNLSRQETDFVRKIKGHIPFRRSQCTFTTWAFSKSQTSNWQKISQRMSGEESFSQILHLSPTLQIFQNGTLNQVHEIWKKNWPKVFFLSIMKMPIRKNISPNPEFMQEKLQKGDFLKKPLRELKNYFCFRFL